MPASSAPCASTRAPARSSRSTSPAPSVSGRPGAASGPGSGGEPRRVGMRTGPWRFSMAAMKTSRARANVLLAAAAWTVYVWVTRMWNVVCDFDHDFGFKAVHSVLAIVSLAFAVALAVIGFRMRREAVRSRDPAGRPDPESRELAGGPDPESPDRQEAVGR